MTSDEKLLVMRSTATMTPFAGDGAKPLGARRDQSLGAIVRKCAISHWEGPKWRDVCGSGSWCGGGLAYPGLGTSSAESVDPDVLGDDVALLVEVCVLLELQRRDGQHLVGSQWGYIGMFDSRSRCEREVGLPVKRWSLARVGHCYWVVTLRLQGCPVAGHRREARRRRRRGGLP